MIARDLNRAGCRRLESAECSFPLLADLENVAFREYGCYDEGPLHGTFVLDASGAVRWRKTSSEPFMDVSAVLAEAASLVEN